MKRLPVRALACVFTTAMAAALTGCGGGGGAAPASTNDPATTTIAGSVVKGPVSGATVTAYSIVGGMMGTALMSTTTDAQGSFAMPLPMGGGPLMLQVTGGTYTDEASGAQVTFAPGQMMTSVLSSLAAGTASVQVTPLTAMAQAMAAGMPGGMTAANVDAANAAVGNYFMAGDVVHTHPMNLLVSGSAAGASASMMNYGAALAAMSQYARNAGVPSSSLVGWMMQDAADGVLDGKAGSTPIAIGSGSGGMMGGGAMMQASAGGAGLASAMADFMASSRNVSGAGTTSMTQLMQQLAAAGGRLR